MHTSMLVGVPKLLVNTAHFTNKSQNCQIEGQSVHRLVLNSAISFECFRNMAIRLLVNSALTLRNSTGDLIVASL
jgi:hypothetical protein